MSAPLLLAPRSDLARLQRREYTLLRNRHLQAGARGCEMTDSQKLTAKPDETKRCSRKEASAGGKTAPGASPPDGGNDYDPFLLEKLYPAPDNLFACSLVPSSAEGSVIVACDTSALLLPYTIRKDDLSALEGVYRRLAAENRIYVPARCVREFIKNRDRKLADMLNALGDIKVEDQRSRRTSLPFARRGSRGQQRDYPSFVHHDSTGYNPTGYNKQPTSVDHGSCF
jgi:hypothetical protein